MTDCFTGIPITSHDLQRRDVAWLRGRYGDSPQLDWDTTRWKPVAVWEQSAAMTCGVRLLDKHGNPIADFPVVIGWPGIEIQAKTNGTGWVDVPINGGNYSPPNTGPMFIRAADRSWEYTGIGWVNGTNHDHLNVTIQESDGTSTTPTPEPPVTPPAPGVGINRADVLAIRANLVASRDAAINGIAYIDRILAGEP